MQCFDALVGRGVDEAFIEHLLESDLAKSGTKATMGLHSIGKIDARYYE